MVSLRTTTTSFVPALRILHFNLPLSKQSLAVNKNSVVDQLLLSYAVQTAVALHVRIPIVATGKQQQACNDSAWPATMAIQHCA